MEKKCAFVPKQKHTITITNKTTNQPLTQQGSVCFHPAHFSKFIIHVRYAYMKQAIKKLTSVKCAGTVKR